MADGKKGMGETELSALCSNEIQGAIGNIGTTVSAQREQAMRYYLGIPFGNEQPERSQVILTEVRDAIEQMMPGLMKIFTSGDEVVRFEPQGPEDVEAAEQATAYINYIIQRDNPGFEILYWWFKDALLQKRGVVKFWVDEKTTVAEEMYSGLTDEEFAALLADDSVEPVEHTEVQVPRSDTILTLHDVRVRRTKPAKKFVISNIPPEEFLISRDATRMDNARFVGHRVVKSVSELTAMGFDPKLIEDLPTEESVYWSTEATTRRYRDDELGTSQPQSLDPSQRRVTVVEGYYRVDYDGDGIAELRQVWTGSLGNPILSNEVWEGDQPPFASLCPSPLPHRFFGLSEADMLTDIQLIKSTLLRNLLDNLYQLNNQRVIVNVGSGDDVNIDDLLTNRVGGIVRTKGAGTVAPLQNEAIGGFVFPALEYMDTVKETRVGVSRNMQGITGEELHKTSGGLNRILDIANERQLLIARIFAETGIKELFRGLLKLVCTHQDEARQIKLNGKWVNMDPREWVNLNDMSINVGLGSGNKQEMQAALMNILNLQIQGMAQGATNLVGYKNIYNTLKKLAEASELRTVDPYFTDPDTQPPPQPKPDPKMQEVQGKLALQQQAAQQKATLDQQKAQQDAQLDMIKAHIDANVKLQVAEMEARLKTMMGIHSANLSGGMPNP